MIAVTGASGQLGRLVVEGLLAAPVPPEQVVAVVRDPAKAADLAALGVQVRAADYNDLEALESALAGVDRVLLISGSEIGSRVAQHSNVVSAARAAGVALVVYTSAPKAEVSTLPVAPEHRETEALIATSGLPAVILRNNWYFENFDSVIAQAAATGQIAGGAGQGRIAAATRADLAGGAVAVLTATDVAPAVLEVGGDEAWTMSELADAVAAETGRTVTYQQLTPAEQTEYLSAAGLPEPMAQFFTAVDEGIAVGDLDTGSHALSTLLGRPTTTLAEYVHQALASA